MFDSGIGGLSVLASMLGIPRPPWGTVLYLADLAHFPYGPRPAEEVRRFALSGVRLLADMGAKAVAVACNTAASSGVRAGEVGLPVPVVDIIGPGARYVTELARRTGAGRVIILGTEGTIRSSVWQDTLRRVGYGREITGWPCPFLAKLIEEGQNGLVAREACREAVRGLGAFAHGAGADNRSAGPGAAADSPPSGPGAAADSRPSALPDSRQGGAPGQFAGAPGQFAGAPGEPGGARPEDRSPDIVVLGCTHYTFVAKALKEALAGATGREVILVDPARALALELVTILEGMGGPSGEPLTIEFFTTGRSDHFRERALQLLGSGAVTEPARRGLAKVTEVSLTDPPSAWWRAQAFEEESPCG